VLHKRQPLCCLRTTREADLGGQNCHYGVASNASRRVPHEKAAHA
jgi:hypothetical protein